MTYNDAFTAGYTARETATEEANPADFIPTGWYAVRYGEPCLADEFLAGWAEFEAQCAELDRLAA